LFDELTGGKHRKRRLKAERLASDAVPRGMHTIACDPLRRDHAIHHREDCMIILYFGRGNDYLRLCFNRAYGDFKRTLGGIRKHPRGVEVRRRADEALIEIFADVKAIETPTQQQFDDWHKSACLRLASIYRDCDYPSFFVGHAHKWLNMAFNFIYFMGEPRLPGFGKLYDLCHVPLDNILITDLSPFGFQNLPCAWSSLNDYEAYLDRQRWVRHHFSFAPLDVEFLLWMGKPLPPEALRDSKSA
jgi:hypothetical protein